MGIAFDNAAFVGTAVAGGSFTVGAGSNRILFVHVSYLMATGGTVHSSAVTYNGVAMTQVPTVGSISEDNGTNKIVNEVWYLVAPASGSHTIAVTVVGTPTTSAVSAASFSGADQTPTFGANTSSTGNTSGSSISAGSMTDSTSGAWGLTFATAKKASGLEADPSSPTVLTTQAYMGTLA
jgi:hypothetical protein